MSYGAEMLCDGEYCGNQLRFASKPEAEAYAKNLYSRWMTPSGWRVVKSKDPVNYRADEYGNTKVIEAPPFIILVGDE